MRRCLNHLLRAWAVSGHACTPAALVSQRDTLSLIACRYHSEQNRRREHWTEAGVGQRDCATDLKQALLTQALQLVPRHGWSAAALHVAARQLGLSPAVIGLFPQPELALVSFFIVQSNNSLQKRLDALDDEGTLLGLDTRARLALAIRLRLEMIAPHIQTWPQALGVLTRPSSVAASAELLYGLVDDMWAAVGDRSTDLSWYSKRAGLAGVYAATELYMLTDYSPEFNDTWQALDRQLDDLVVLRGAVRDAQKVVAGAYERACSSRSVRDAEQTLVETSVAGNAGIVTTPPNSAGIVTTPPNSAGIVTTPPNSAVVVTTPPNSAVIVTTPPHNAGGLLSNHGAEVDDAAVKLCSHVEDSRGTATAETYTST